MEAIKILIIYLAVINLAAFIAFGIDKHRAKTNRFRISEASLILFAVFFGSIGALLGMYVFHHKTAKVKFYVGIPAILILQIIITVLTLVFKPFELSFM